MLNERRFLCFCLIVFLLFAPVLAAENSPPVTIYGRYKEKFEIGAQPGEMISFGGITVNTEYGLFTTSECDGICLNGSSIVPEKATRLNFLNGNLYYIADGDVCRYNVNSKERLVIFSINEDARQFYVVNDIEFWYLTDSGIFVYENGEQNEVLSDDSLFGFAPTPYGIVYATGNLFDYSIYAGGRRIAEHSSDFSVDYDLHGGCIIFENDGRNYYITLNAAFSESGMVKEYQGQSIVDTEDLFGGLVNPDADEIVAQSENQTKRTLRTSYRKSLSVGVQNIVCRAYQMTNIQWTPKANIIGWGGGLIYYAGQTYTGLPYGQPVNASYVPWTTSLTQFISFVNDPNSKMYSSYSSYNQRAPYYSIDCSAFVSWAWDLSSRQTTSTIHNYASLISSSSYANMQVGDCLCKAGSHVVLVTDITYDERGVINGVEISESTVNAATYYCCQKTWYGTGYSYSLSTMQSKYLGSGYSLYRSNSRDSVSYTHCSVVVLEDDVHSDTLTSITPATCTRAGQNVYTCTVCGLSRTESIPAQGHAFGEWAVTEKPNCITSGLETRTCTACGFQETRTTPAAGHSYETQKIPATCTEDGYDLYICSFCGKSFSDNIVTAPGHSFDRGICSVCGEIDSSIQKGDLNLDGNITSADAVLLARYLVDAVSLDEAQQYAADMNRDGTVSSADAVLLAKELVSK